jgi:hypothetical protein
MTTLTKPTVISEAQYNAAFFLIDSATADHYIIWQDNYGIDRSLYIGTYTNSLKEPPACIHIKAGWISKDKRSPDRG